MVPHGHGYSPHSPAGSVAACTARVTLAPSATLPPVDEQTLTPAGEQRRIGLTYIQNSTVNTSCRRVVSVPFAPKTAALLTALQPPKSSKSASTSGTIFRVFAQVFMAFSSTSYKFREVACNLSFIYGIIVFAIGQVSITKRFEGVFLKNGQTGKAHQGGGL